MDTGKSLYFSCLLLFSAALQRIVPRSAADRSLCVQLDVICSVNDQGVKHKSRDRVRELISQSGENLLLKVVTANPVRLANTRKDILQVISLFRTFPLLFRTHEVSLWAT